MLGNFDFQRAHSDRRSEWFLNLVSGLILFFGALLPHLPFTAHAASSAMKIPGGGQLLVNAQNAFRDYEKGILELSGDVQIFYKQQYISCDRAVVNEKSSIVETWGSLVISSATTYVEGTHAVLNYKENTGIIENGFVKSGQVIFEGKTLRKLGPNHYEADQSYYTACTTCPTAWTFTGSHMDAEVGGYARIKNPIMRIADVPVLWLPYLVIPLKSERQTGFLIPTFEYDSSNGKSGFMLGPRFFWAINRSHDILFTTKYYTLRGIKLLTEYNYVLSNDSAGTLNFGLMKDQVFEQDDYFSKNPGNKPKPFRWFLNYDHKYELPGGFSQKTFLNSSSDIWYPRDYWLEMPGRGDPALENRVSLSHNTETSHMSAEVDYYINLLKDAPVASNDDAVHRWPELKYSYANRPIGGSRFLAGLNIDYVNFARDGLGFDDVNFTPKRIDRTRSDDPANTSPTGGVFNPERDLVRTGQRLDIRPEISYPMSAGPYLDLLPVLQFRHTQYSFNVSSPTLPYDTTPSRSYAQASLSARTRFYRIYGSEPKFAPSKTATGRSSFTDWVDEESRESRDKDTVKKLEPPPRPAVYRHEIMPELTASYLPWLNQPTDHPFFAQAGQVPIFLEDVPIKDSDFESTPTAVQFDYFDRLPTRTTVSLFTTNRLVRKRWQNGAIEYKQIASWKIGEAYDIEEANRSTVIRLPDTSGALTREAPKLPLGDIKSIFTLNLEQIDVYSSIQYFPYHRVTDSDSYLTLKSKSGRQFVQTSYHQKYKITRDPDSPQKEPDSLTFTTGFISRYADVATSLSYLPQGFAPVNFDLQSYSVDLNLKPPGNCWGIKIHYERPLNVKEPLIKFDLAYNFGGTL